jgi:3-deoxy-7-phosphoheptulonate synthase
MLEISDNVLGEFSPVPLWIRNCAAVLLFPAEIDQNIVGRGPLTTPDLIRHEIPTSQRSLETIIRGRRDCIRIIVQKDDRLLAMVGPCSIHDPDTAREYCARLKMLSDKLQDDLLIIMRAYVENPRTTVGWKGLIKDPGINQTFMMNKGLRLTRSLFADITLCGMPIATEITDEISPQYLADLLSVGTVGGRTTGSKLHQEVASGLGFPVGFQNGMGGDLRIAINAVRVVKHEHNFLSSSPVGVFCITKTAGNEHCFVILRGYNDAESIAEAKAAMEQAHLLGRLMVDCSHEDSRNNRNHQLQVVDKLSTHISNGETGIFGVNILSNINEGSLSVNLRNPLLTKYFGRLPGNTARRPSCS